MAYLALLRSLFRGPQGMHTLSMYMWARGPKCEVQKLIFQLMPEVARGIWPRPLLLDADDRSPVNMANQHVPQYLERP
eukprot:4222875-Amphidinium_carterae.1